MKILSILIITFCIHLNTFAQTPAVIKKPAVTKPIVQKPATPKSTASVAAPVEKIYPQRFQLDANGKEALNEQKKIAAENEQSKSLLNKDYDPCKVELLSFRKSYTDWYLDHSCDFEKSIPNIKELNSKLDRIKNLEVQVNPVEGNLTDFVSVSFTSLASFIGIYNGREDACSNSPEKIALLEKQMDKPHLNTLGIALSQVPKALDLFTPFLNEKLVETPFSYQLKLIKTNCKLSVGIMVFVNKKTEQDVPFYEDILINEAGKPQLQLNPESESAWRLFTLNEVKISEKAIDGFSRYFEFLKDAPAACLPDAAPLDPSLQQYASFINSGPFVTYDEWADSYKKLKSKVASFADKPKELAQFQEKFQKPMPPVVQPALTASSATGLPFTLLNGTYVSQTNQYRKVVISNGAAEYISNKSYGSDTLIASGTNLSFLSGQTFYISEYDGRCFTMKWHNKSDDSDRLCRQ